MIKSMTGFGRGEARLNGKCFLVELKTVNHRYTDISIKLPKKFTYLEENIRKILKNHILRGRVELFITFENESESEVKARVDLPLANEYLKALEEISKQLRIDNDVTTSLVSRFPDVIKLEKKDEDEDEIWCCLQEALLTALDKLVAMRSEEGKKLRSDLLKRLEKNRGYVLKIKERSYLLVEEYRQRLKERIEEILDEDISVDDNRIAVEVALLADKSNITEEIVRLNSHIDQFEKTLEEDEAIGRKLDFLLQEMNRETNTIGSKANDLIVANLVIDIKSELEKMREQVQNIE